MKTDQEIAAYLAGVMDEDALAEFEAAAVADPDLQRTLLAQRCTSAALHALLGDSAELEKGILCALNAPPVAESVARVVAGTSKDSASRKIIWMPARRARRALAAAAVLIAAALVMAVHSFPRGKRSGPATTAGAAVPLILDSGTATLDFANGARITVLAPARVQTLGPAEARLISGRVMVFVPPAARGFALETPGGRVVDLGTRFGAASENERSVAVHVFEGRVEVSTRQRERLLLAAGDGAVVEAARGVTTRLAASEAAFASASAGAQPKRGARFTELYDALHNPANGYFSGDGIPYHSVETLICEAPDYGHLTTSETFSYWLWLEAMRGRMTGDWSRLSAAWEKMERVMIPSHAEQPTAGYKPGKPSSYAAEWEQPEKYPAKIDAGSPVGRDPLFDELRSTYGAADLYGMHWLLDVDNWYGYGRRGEAGARAGFINTFQRGPAESVWETVPHPSWENFAAGGPNGFLDLFVKDARYAQQWRYTNAPDADARAVQAAFWAKKWADEKGGSPATDALAAKAARMGDCLRYAMFDKHFRKIGEPAQPGAGRTTAHHLLGWYYAWGGSLTEKGGWAFRVGSSHIHCGYQNPLAAFALSETVIPKSPTARQDWKASVGRQLEFYRWLQSAEGAIAGGATNSWNGRYETPPPGTATFYGMPYQEHPVYLDPGSNSWFGMQAWSMQRVAELYFVSGNPAAKQVLDRWVAWVLASVQLPPDGSFAVPSTIEWSGQPDVWNPKSPGANARLHATVRTHSQDVGVAASLARSLLYYSAAEKLHAGREHVLAKTTAATLLDRIWALGRDPLGVALPEQRPDYRRFFEEQVHIPDGWIGRLPTGAEVRAGATFLSVRPQYRKDPAFPALQQAWDAWSHAGKKGEFASPTYRYHRFWAQVEVALANAEYDMLFPQN